MPQRQLITSSAPWEPIAGYSRAVRVSGDLAFMADGMRGVHIFRMAGKRKTTAKVSPGRHILRIELSTSFVQIDCLFIFVKTPTNHADML